MTEQPFREEQDPREDHDGAEPQPAPFPPELDPLDPHFGGEEELEDEDEAIARELTEMERAGSSSPVPHGIGEDLEADLPHLAPDPREDAFSAESVAAELRGRAPETQMAPRLDAMRLAMDLLGDPAHAAPVIHLTGTNGKTSTARMVEALLMAHDLRVGRYTSPHLEKVTERIAVDGAPIDDATFVRTWDEIRPFLLLADQRLTERGEVALTEFEAMTVLAFAVFAEAPVDVMVLEVGLGGRWDATNVADAAVSVLTPIDLDHTRMLGDTVEEIAREKAGIIKPDGFLVSSAQRPSVAEILLEAARDRDVPFRFGGVEFGVRSRVPGPGGQVLAVQGLAGVYEDLALPLAGEHQADNAALAIAAVEAFLGGGERELNVELVRAGLAAVRSPGRLETVRTAPTVIIDAAHNPHGLRAQVRAVEETVPARELEIVLGILTDKDAAQMLRILRESYAESERFDARLYVSASHSPRAIDPQELARLAVAEGFDEDAVQAFAGLDEAITAAVSDAAVREELDAAVLITGSVTVAGEARMLLGPLPESGLPGADGEPTGGEEGPWPG